MPMQSQAERAFLHIHHPQIAARFEAETPKGKKLPKHVHHKKDEHKKAFVASFLEKCAALGLHTPEQIIRAADALTAKVTAATEKRAGIGDTVSSALGGLTGLPVLTAGLGLAAPAAVAYGGGYALGTAKNQSDLDDADALRRAALANAYRRRTAELKVNGQVRRLLSDHPGQYVVVG